MLQTWIRVIAGGWMTTTKVLFTGDLHLGRHPTRIPQDHDGRQFSPKAIWKETVNTAIERDVDIVAISGDVVDRENRFFEAFGAFESGVRELMEADIPVVTVAGNHDFDVLPRMIEEFDFERLTLLGRDGTWDRWTLERDGDPVLHIDGWSFADEYVFESPVDEYELDGSEGTPVLGLLHADFGAQESRYAPVSPGELTSHAVDGWLLGHIHAPQVHREADPFIQYPGSLQPLDPGEPGEHGPWLLEVDDSGSIDAEHLPIATLRYQELEVDATGIDDPNDVANRISEEIESQIVESGGAGRLEVLLPRVRLTGRTDAHADLVAEQTDLERQLTLQQGSVSVQPESVEVRTRPAVDLAELEGGEGPVAALAGILRDLSEDDRSVDEDLLQNATATMQEAATANTYSPLTREGRIEQPGEEQAREYLQTQARTLLDTLLEQKEGTA